MVSLEETRVCQTNVLDLGGLNLMNYGFLGSGAIVWWLQILYMIHAKFDLSTYGWLVSTRKDGRILVAVSSLPSAFWRDFTLIYHWKFHQKTKEPPYLFFNCEWVDFDSRFCTFCCLCAWLSNNCEIWNCWGANYLYDAEFRYERPLDWEHQLVDATASHISCEGYEPSQLMMFCESFCLLVEFDLVGTAFVCPNNGGLLCCFEKVGRYLQGTNPGVSYLDRLLVSSFAWLVPVVSSLVSQSLSQSVR